MPVLSVILAILAYGACACLAVGAFRRLASYSASHSRWGLGIIALFGPATLFACCCLLLTEQVRRQAPGFWRQEIPNPHYKPRR